MSQPASDAPNPSQPDGELLLGIGELALFAHLGGRLPLAMPALPEQPEEAWVPVLDHVIERGLLLRNGDEVSLPEALGPLLAPIAEGDFAMDASVGERHRSWLAVDETIIEITPVDDETVRITPIAYDDYEPLVEAFLGFAGAVRGVDGEPQPVPVDQLAVAVEQADNDQPVEFPAAPEFGAALERGTLNRVEVRWVEEAEVFGSRREWVDAGESGLWVATADDEDDNAVTVQPRATVSLWEGIAGLLP